MADAETNSSVQPAQLRDILSREDVRDDDEAIAVWATRCPSVSISFSLKAAPHARERCGSRLHHNIAGDGGRLFAILTCEPVVMRFDPP